MGGPDERSKKTETALRAVHAASQVVMNARRKPDLIDARRRRDRAIVRAAKLASETEVARVAGLSVTRVKQICVRRPERHADTAD